MEYECLIKVNLQFSACFQVALSRRAVKSSNPPPLCNLELSQYGIRMFDKSEPTVFSCFQVALSRRAVKSSNPPPLCNLELSQYGIRMFDKSKTGVSKMISFKSLVPGPRL